jgi:hypothetical protein
VHFGLWVDSSDGKGERNWRRITIASSIDRGGFEDMVPGH